MYVSQFSVSTSVYLRLCNKFGNDGVFNSFFFFFDFASSHLIWFLSPLCKWVNYLQINAEFIRGAQLLIGIESVYEDWTHKFTFSWIGLIGFLFGKNHWEIHATSNNQMLGSVGDNDRSSKRFCSSAVNGFLRRNISISVRTHANDWVESLRNARTKY